MPSLAQTPDTPREAALQVVLRRLGNCAGFPTLSTTISDINSVVETESHSARQLTQAEKAARADHVVRNDRDLPALEQELARVLEKLGAA